MSTPTVRRFPRTSIEAFPKTAAYAQAIFCVSRHTWIDRAFNAAGVVIMAALMGYVVYCLFSA